MSYRIVYSEMPQARGEGRIEVFLAEHQALGRARELIETGEHNGVTVRDNLGNELRGVRLQLMLGGFLGE